MKDPNYDLIARGSGRDAFFYGPEPLGYAVVEVYSAMPKRDRRYAKKKLLVIAGDRLPDGASLGDRKPVYIDPIAGLADPSTIAHKVAHAVAERDGLPAADCGEAALRVMSWGLTGRGTNPRYCVDAQQSGSGDAK